MAHRLLRDPDADGWERADFPIVCETCLGPNPYVRMQRMEFGGECHISGRPYTKFRWRPGNDARYKGTIICQEVAKAKNVCQVCLLDLDYNLPVQVRDQALGMEDEALPESDVGREFALERMANEGELGVGYNKSKANDTILKLQRTAPYYQRNRAQICSFFVKGECKRGAECPYRHEMPTTGELAKQNIKDRYFGVNDPVAKKMMGRVHDMPQLKPPEDPTITTLFVGGVTPEIGEADLQDAFAVCGDVSKVKKVESRSCAFVTFSSRADAESAAEKLQNKLIVKGTRLKLMWGRPQERRAEGGNAAGGPAAVPGGMIPPHVQRQMGGGAPFPPPAGPNFFNLPAAQASYPSQDPQQAGTRMTSQGDAQKRKADGEAGLSLKRPAGPSPQHYHPMMQPGYPAARPPPGYGYARPPGAYPPGQAPAYPPPSGAAPPVAGWGPPPARPPVQAKPEAAGAE